jgi:hypothetical protein
MDNLIFNNIVLQRHIFEQLIIGSVTTVRVYTLCHVSGVCVTTKTGFGFDDWIYCILYIHANRDYKKYSAIAILHTFQLTVAHALEFSFCTSRILATDLSQSHCNIK